MITIDKDNKLLASYKNGDYTVFIFENGTKIREGEGVPYLPESIDVKITDYCDAGCPWCHEGSSVNGKHAYLGQTVDLLSQLPAGAEIAIGGGNPLSHPYFYQLLGLMSVQGIICNVTVNEKHFENAVETLLSLIKHGYIKGIGYSYYKEPCLFEYEHLVTHVNIGITSPEEIEQITQVNKKVLLLGYKYKGRGVEYKRAFNTQVYLNIAMWYRYLPMLLEKYTIGFDTLAVEQLKPERLFLNAPELYQERFMGVDGTFSMYLDAVEEKYTVSSSYLQQYPYSYPLSLHEYFQHIRTLV